MSSLPPATDLPAARPASRTRLVKDLQERGTHQRWVLLAGLAGMFANNFPFTVLTVALDPIGAELGASKPTMAWVITAPIFFSAVALPILGKLGDLHGHRRIFLLGSAAAAVTALLTALAWDAWSLIGLRTLSSILGAATGPSSMALIFSVYGREDRPRAMGWWTMMGAGAPALGLLAGGPLIDQLGWRVLFLLQGAFALAALWFAWLVLAETALQRVRFDLGGSLTLALGAGAVMFCLGRAHDLGAGSPLILGAAAVAVANLALFVRIERRVVDPLLPLGFFALANFTAPILSGALMGGAYMGAFVLAPFVLQGVFARSLSVTALIMLLRTLTLTFTSPLGGYLGERFGERTAALLGNSVITASMGMLALGADLASLPIFGAGLLLQGMGQGLCSPSLTSAVADAVPQESVAIATAANRLVGQVGTAFGITLLTGIYGGVQSSFRAAFGAGALLAALSVLAAIFMRPRSS